MVFSLKTELIFHIFSIFNSHPWNSQSTGLSLTTGVSVHHTESEVLPQKKLVPDLLEEENDSECLWSDEESDRSHLSTGRDENHVHLHFLSLIMYFLFPVSCIMLVDKTVSPCMMGLIPNPRIVGEMEAKVTDRWLQKRFMVKENLMLFRLYLLKSRKFHNLGFIGNNWSPDPLCQNRMELKLEMENNSTPSERRGKIRSPSVTMVTEFLWNKGESLCVCLPTTGCFVWTWIFSRHNTHFRPSTTPRHKRGWRGPMRREQKVQLLRQDSAEVNFLLLKNKDNVLWGLLTQVGHRHGDMCYGIFPSPVLMLRPSSHIVKMPVFASGRYLLLSN